MAYWGRRYRRYRKYRRFYRRFRRGRYSYARKYVNSSSRSNIRMKTLVTSTFNVTAGYGDDGTGAGVTFVDPLAATTANSMTAAGSDLYKTYCSLYEECKIVGSRINLSIVSAVGGSDIPSVQIFTCWDRKHGYGEPAPTVADVKKSATNNVATALNNNVAKLTRSCFASDLMEKATWFDSTLDSANGNRNKAWYTAGLNPNMFCPSFAFFLNCPSLGAAKQISVSMSIVYYIAFRNPRYGGSSSAKMIDLGSRPLAPDDDGDMDDDDAPPRAAPQDLEEVADGDIDAVGDIDNPPPAAQAAADTAAQPVRRERAGSSSSAAPVRRRARAANPLTLNG